MSRDVDKSRRRAEDAMKRNATPKHDATGKLGPKPSHGDAAETPLCERIVTNVELWKLGFWRP